MGVPVLFVMGWMTTFRPLLPRAGPGALSRRFFGRPRRLPARAGCTGPGMRRAVSGSIGTEVRARLARVGVTVSVLGRSGLVSRATVNRILAGQDSIKSPVVAARLEYALGWRAGSLSAIRAGGEPIEIKVATWPRLDGDWAAAIDEAWALDAPTGRRQGVAWRWRVRALDTAAMTELEPDSRSALMAGRYEDLLEHVKTWPVPASAPDGVAALLGTSRRLFAHAWFVYEFAAVGVTVSLQAVEAALRDRLGSGPGPALQALIERALKERLISEQDADRLDAGRKLRNRFSHPREQAAMPLAMCGEMIRYSHEVASALYPD